MTKLPLHIERILDAHGIGREDVRWFIRGDAADDGTVCDVYLVLTEDAICRFSGIEEVVSVKGARKLETAFALKDSSRIDIRPYDTLKIERMISTSQLIAASETDAVCVAVFPIGQTGELEKLQKAFDAMRAGRPVGDCVLSDDRCPQCGTRYPEQERKVCPNCLSRMSVTGRLFGFFKGYLRHVLAVTGGDAAEYGVWHPVAVHRHEAFV